MYPYNIYCLCVCVVCDCRRRLKEKRQACIDSYFFLFFDTFIVLYITRNNAISRILINLIYSVWYELRETERKITFKNDTFVGNNVKSKFNYWHNINNKPRCAKITRMINKQSCLNFCFWFFFWLIITHLHESPFFFIFFLDEENHFFS